MFTVVTALPLMSLFISYCSDLSLALTLSYLLSSLVNEESHPLTVSLCIVSLQLRGISNIFLLRWSLINNALVLSFEPFWIPYELETSHSIVSILITIDAAASIWIISPTLLVTSLRPNGQDCRLRMFREIHLDFLL